MPPEPEDRAAHPTWPDLAGGRLLVVGRAGLDLYADPPGTPVEAAGRFTAALGGSAGNIAVALARQGCRVGLLTRLSDDAVGRFVARALAQDGVVLIADAPAPGEARTSLAVVDTCGDATQAVIYRNGAADFALTPEDAGSVDPGAFDGVILTGTAFAIEPSRSAGFQLLGRMRAAGRATILDLDHRPYSWSGLSEASAVLGRAAALCDIVVGNDVEFAVLAGAGDAEAGLRTARDLAATGARLVVHKMGAQGSISLTPDAEWHTPVFPVAALKPTGAGDAFLGGLIAALAQGADAREAVRRGAAAAAIVVARVGCAPAMPTRDELDAFLAAREA